MSERSTTTHRRHTIIATRSGDVWRARSFRGKTPTSTVCVAAGELDAVDLVRAELDEGSAREVAARGANGFPTSGHFLEAFEIVRCDISQNQLAMLYAHADAPDQTMTATQLAAAAGKPGYEFANLQYGKLARLICEEMDFTPPQRRADGAPIWTFGLAVGADDREELSNTDPEMSGEWRWRLRPEVSQALTQLKDKK